MTGFQLAQWQYELLGVIGDAAPVNPSRFTLSLI